MTHAVVGGVTGVCWVVALMDECVLWNVTETYNLYTGKLTGICNETLNLVLILDKTNILFNN